MKWLVNFIFVATLVNSFIANGQSLNDSKQIIADLCSTTFKGRGYIDDGVNKAADYLEAHFSRLKLRKFGSNYFQAYQMKINTHPFPIRCMVDGKGQKAGIDFLVDGGSGTFQGNYQLIHFNMNDSSEKILLLKKIKKGFAPNEALVLRKYNLRNRAIYDSCKLYDHLPTLFIGTEEKKLTHGLSTALAPFNSLTFADSILQQKENIEIEVKNTYLENFTAKNLIGYVKGKKKDSFIVFTAHYDHLGMQGTEALFPGASDNASGVSMLFYLAEHYSKTKPLYNTIFILFSGEEAGLLGSESFTKNPTFDLNKIKLVINVDIMGNASNGITVVNGENCRSQFNLLTALNEQQKFIPEIKIRGQTKNSDHFHFSEKGVPAIFIYSLGGKGYYHDVFDKADSIDLTNFEQVAKLLIQFCKAL